MRTDAAAIARIADHQVVQPHVGDEAELAQQRVGIVIVEIDALDQQRPVGLRRRRQIGLRPGIQFPLAAAAGDQTGFDLILCGQRKQFVACKESPETRQRLPDQKGFLVPVVAQELGRRYIAQ